MRSIIHSSSQSEKSLWDVEGEVEVSIIEERRKLQRLCQRPATGIQLNSSSVLHHVICH